ncbi:hypothetical protein [Cupriavidus oxalaticus]|uniref:Uncharacterized protein n=1 Tax=Cupriavidus oxalaticus TaxID=96344 RepID=A0A375G0D7_9BURK|nr:hypothetical protein [Cupriavidus oxalaticus]QRQ86018.1 hypothetical protein JTE91_22565 [Cupriavidus oxalaticus]QRQ95655.1 hypothetical protein JTE92_19695 [Cupriavidus oxalaticus]WQD84321.1 hypothetical protein U0036_07415 [Cupriavidus oxalaticus]SPC10506.1 exported hypothetical protein [Cupriavidus oxalaticus]SPC12212.1 exported hypothetical protein [Cupriavidus oxalaticus]
MNTKLRSPRIATALAVAALCITLAPTAGIEPAGGSSAQFSGFIQTEMAKWAKVARNAGIQPE